MSLNQMRTFGKASGDIAELVDAFFANDPYYPRPEPSSVLYSNFKKGYMGSCSPESRTRAALFLQAIEARYAEGSAVA